MFYKMLLLYLSTYYSDRLEYRIYSINRPGRFFEAGRLLTFSAFRMGAYSRLGAYSNKYGMCNKMMTCEIKE